jgi:glycolate oxidase FAD binding subunit
MKASTHTMQAALEPLVGGRVRPAEASETMAGVQPHLVVEPADEEEVAAVLRFADQQGLKVLPRGGGEQAGFGFPPTGGDIILRTVRLHKIIEHAPEDLTVTVQAGLRLTDLQASLADAQQWLALDPMLGPEATIGGIIATNATGPRRLRYNGVRDQIIGVRVVLPDGTIAKGGGKVVKNVAGYDLPKLFTGSLGTLGVIVSASFRLYPLTADSRTVVLHAGELAPLCDLALRVLDSALVPTLLDITCPLSEAEEYTLAVRFEMEQASVEQQASTLLEMAADVSKSKQALHGEDEAHFWSLVAAHTPVWDRAQTGLLVKASVLPTEVAFWLESLQQTCQQSRLDGRWRAHAGHGLIFARLSGDATALRDALNTLRLAATRRQGSLVVIDAPPSLAGQFDVWGTSPALEIMHRLKARFDPHATLNPGRFLGGI